MFSWVIFLIRCIILLIYLILILTIIELMIYNLQPIPPYWIENNNQNLETIFIPYYNKGKELFILFEDHIFSALYRWLVLLILFVLYLRLDTPILMPIDINY